MPLSEPCVQFCELPCLSHVCSSVAPCCQAVSGFPDVAWEAFGLGGKREEHLFNSWWALKRLGSLTLVEATCWYFWLSPGSW